MDILKNLKEALEKMEGLHCGVSSAETVIGVADRAQPNFGSTTATISAESIGAVISRSIRRNGSGAKKRRAKRKHENSVEPLLVPQTLGNNTKREGGAQR